MTEARRAVELPIHKKCLVRNRILHGVWILAPGFLWVAFGLTAGIGLPWLRAAAFIGALLLAAMAVLFALAAHRNFQGLCQLYLQVNEPELWSRISGGSYLDRILGNR
jgi:hypothetical protein